MNAAEIKKAFDYEKEIDNQLNQFKKTRISSEIIQKFEDNKFEVIEELLNLNIPEKDYYGPIPVIPIEYGRLYPLINCVYYNSGVNQRPGTTGIDPTKITSNGCSQLHYICGVNLGKNLVKESFEETEKLILEEGSHPLTTSEIIAFATFYEWSYYKQASISGADRYMENKFLGICLRTINCLSYPYLGYVDDPINLKWTMPFCKHIIKI